MEEQQKYYVLSLKWSSGESYVWWGANNSGYTTDLNEAGVYTEEQINKRKSYYSNTSTMPVLCSTVRKGQTRLISVLENDNRVLFGIREHLKTAKEY